MVEKMKMVHIVTTASAKEEMLKALREMGVVHLAEKQSADREVSERFQTMSRMEMALKDYADPKQEAAKEILADDEFQKMYSGALDAMERKSLLGQEISAANTEIDRISAWGATSTSTEWEAKNCRPLWKTGMSNLFALLLSTSRTRSL